jgi:hypothetical protein
MRGFCIVGLNMVKGCKKGLNTSKFSITQKTQYCWLMKIKNVDEK